MKLKKTLMLNLFLSLFFNQAFSSPQNWSKPFLISQNNSDVGQDVSPLAIDTNSQAIVGWLGGPQPGNGQDLFTASQNQGQTVWNGLELLYTERASNSFPAAPLLNTDIFNNQWALWGDINISSSIPITTIKIAKQAAGAEKWSTPIPSAMLTGGPNGGDIGFDSFGNLVGLLPVKNNGTYQITLLTFVAGTSSWRTPIQVGTDATDLSNDGIVAVAFKNNRATLLWRTDTPTRSIQARRYNFSENLITPVNNVPIPSEIMGEIIRIVTSIDPNGNTVAFITGNKAAGQEPVCYVTTLLANSDSWSSPILVANPADGSIGLGAKIDSQGNAVLLWIEGSDPSLLFIRGADLPLGGTLQNITALTDPTPTNTTIDFSEVVSNLAMDCSGNVVGIWDVIVDGNTTIQVASKPAGGSWSSTTTFSNSGITPWVVLSDQGTSVAIWADSITGAILGSTNLNLFPLDPPKQVKGTLCKNRFLTQEVIILKLKWIPSCSPNIVKYEIRQGNQVIAKIPGIIGICETCVSVPSSCGNGSFTLTAVASNGNISQPVLINIR